jgi:hypothetical protein
MQRSTEDERTQSHDAKPTCSQRSGSTPVPPHPSKGEQSAAQRHGEVQCASVLFPFAAVSWTAADLPVSRANFSLTAREQRSSGWNVAWRR